MVLYGCAIVKWSDESQYLRFPYERVIYVRDLHSFYLNSNNTSANEQNINSVDSITVIYSRGRENET